MWKKKKWNSSLVHLRSQRIIEETGAKEFHHDIYHKIVGASMFFSLSLSILLEKGEKFAMCTLLNPDKAL